METRPILERRLILSLVSKYSSEGYDVIEAPSQEQLPDFLAGYHPDLLLSKAGKLVVVEVKSRASLAKEPQINKMAWAVRAEPGWEFELAVVNTGEQIDAPEDARPFATEDIWRVVAEAESLLTDGFAEAALLRAWSGVEAIVRLLTEEEDWLTDRPTSENILGQAVHVGAISRTDYWFLHHALRHRNAYAHGLATPDFDASLVDALIGMTKRLLRSAPLPESS